IAFLDDVRRLVLVGEFTRNGLEHIDGRHHAFDRPELVRHHHQLAARTLEGVDQVQDPYGLVHDDGVAQARQAYVAVRDQVGDHFLGAPYAYDLVKRSATHREKAVGRPGDLFAQGVRLIVEVDPGHVRAGRHDR